MPKKEATRNSRTSPGRKSKKRTGFVTQSIRLEVADNKTIHAAAKSARQSFNSWAVDTLIAAAETALHQQALKDRKLARLKEKSIG